MKVTAREGIIEISRLARVLGKKKTPRRNGAVMVKSFFWSPKDLRDVVRVLHAEEVGRSVCVDGPCPAWVGMCITHSLHPSIVRLNSLDGYVAVGTNIPKGNVKEGHYEEGKFHWNVERRGDVWLVDLSQVDPTKPYCPDDLMDLEPPQVPAGSVVVISGRMPNYMSASMAMAYHHKCAACAAWQRNGTGIVVWSHSKDITVGDVVPCERN